MPLKWQILFAKPPIIPPDIKDIEQRLGGAKC